MRRNDRREPLVLHPQDVSFARSLMRFLHFGMEVLEALSFGSEAHHGGKSTQAAILLLALAHNRCKKFLGKVFVSIENPLEGRSCGIAGIRFLGSRGRPD
jgi:hypothetical protein